MLLHDGFRTALRRVLDGRYIRVAAVVLAACTAGDALGAPRAVVGGTLQRWHCVTVDFTGPDRREEPATFRDYRLDVTFTHTATGTKLVVPGFFAADGRSADSGAASGTVWRANFAPPLAGAWTYRASFRTGTDVAASASATAGTAQAPIDGANGGFTVGAGTATGRDFRALGPLRHTSGHYARFAGGTTFVKGGSDSPEDLLAFADIDGTVATHRYATHVAEWRAGDPTWHGGRGKGLIGAINYLSGRGINSLYLLTLNARGDSNDVWPWTTATATTTYDVSKLAQWEIVLTHMERRGIAAQLVLQDDVPLDMFDSGNGSVARSIYYREIVARFAHHNALFIIPKEEIHYTRAQILAIANLFRALDPYDHPIILHNDRNKGEATFAPLLGTPPIDGVSLQEVDPTPIVRRWVSGSASAGRPWTVTWDEQAPTFAGAFPDDRDGAAANNDKLRKKWWQIVFNSSAGAEWILRPGGVGVERSIEDFHRWDSVWRWTGAAVSIVAQAIPVALMRNADALTTPTTDSVMAQAGQVYAIYLPEGGRPTLDLTGYPRQFSVKWYDPRAGGGPQLGSVATVTGGTKVDLGDPPRDPAKDWVVVARRL